MLKKQKNLPIKKQKTYAHIFIGVFLALLIVAGIVFIIVRSNAGNGTGTGPSSGPPGVTPIPPGVTPGPPGVTPGPPGVTPVPPVTPAPSPMLEHIKDCISNNNHYWCYVDNACYLHGSGGSACRGVPNDTDGSANCVCKPNPSYSGACACSEPTDTTCDPTANIKECANNPNTYYCYENMECTTHGDPSPCHTGPDGCVDIANDSCSCDGTNIGVLGGESCTCGKNRDKSYSKCCSLSDMESDKCP
jgi:hypothetical protein